MHKNMLFLLKNYEDLPALGAPPPDPLLAAGGKASRPLMVSGSWGLCPKPRQPPLIQKSWLRHWSSPIQHIYLVELSFYVLAVALFIYYTSVPTGTEVK